MANIEVYARYDADWHLYVDEPGRGTLGFCAGGGEDAFDPAAAAAALAAGGWKVTGPWREVPLDAWDAEEGQFAAPVVRVAPDPETVL